MTPEEWAEFVLRDVETYCGREHVKAPPVEWWVTVVKKIAQIEREEERNRVRKLVNDMTGMWFYRGKWPTTMEFKAERDKLLKDIEDGGGV